MRGFLGGFGGGSNSGIPKKNTASAEMKQQILKGGKIQETAQEKMHKMIEQKKAKMMQAIMEGDAKKFQMPGAKAPEKTGMSKSAKKMMQMLAEKKAKKEMDKLNQQVVIKPKSFPNGGKLSADGKLTDATGKLIGTVEAKTGNIKNAMGMTVGKYKEGFMTNNKLSNMIANAAPRTPTAAPAAPAGGGFSINDFYGYTDKKDDSWW